jgi:predicted ATPase/DNA-binding winged helix-turn-helix (wHTH) protein
MFYIGKLQVNFECREVHCDGKPVTIGSRALDALEALVNANGALVSKEQIMHSVWPDTVVEENNLHVQIAALRKALGDDRDLIKTVPGRGYQLPLTAFSRRDATWPTWQSANPQQAAGAPEAGPEAGPEPVAGHAMPLPTAPLIGRDDAVHSVSSLLESARVVTLVGAGGIGKTKLALAVVANLADRFPDGIFFVRLALATDARLVPQAMATSLGMTTPAHDPVPDPHIADILRVVKGRKILIVLDNCEHVIDAAAEVVEAVCQATHPGARILATSREVLRARDEVLYRVPPLELPPPHDCAERILLSSAVQLFLAHARAIEPRFSVGSRSLSKISTICRRLDGIPLAIELAAERAAVIGVDVLADCMNEWPIILTGGRRTAAPRYQTITATLDWSYGLLDERERKVLQHLAIFSNGFTFDAACDVLGKDRETDGELMDTLASLVNKSMVLLEGNPAQPRYRLLDMTRRYALQQREGHGEHQTLLPPAL